MIPRLTSIVKITSTRYVKWKPVNPLIPLVPALFVSISSGTYLVGELSIKCFGLDSRELYLGKRRRGIQEYSILVKNAIIINCRRWTDMKKMDSSSISVVYEVCLRETSWTVH
jgi:hypothetical protein